MTGKPSSRFTPEFEEFIQKFCDFIVVNGVTEPPLVTTSADFTPMDGFVPSSYLVFAKMRYSICINMVFASGDAQKDDEMRALQAAAGLPEKLNKTWHAFLHQAPPAPPAAPVHPFIGKPVPGLDNAFYNNSSENNENAMIIIGTDKYILKSPPGAGSMFAKYWFKVN